MREHRWKESRTGRGGIYKMSHKIKRKKKCDQKRYDKLKIGSLKPKTNKTCVNEEFHKNVSYFKEF